MARNSTKWRMLALATIAQSCATGLNAGSYGSLVHSFEGEFKVSRGLASMGMALLLLTMSLLSPTIGRLLNRVPIRPVMISGALLNVVGYLILAFATNMYLVLAVYGLVLGPACCMLGIVPASTLATRWFPENNGKALAVVNTPLVLLLLPPIAASVVQNHGMSWLFFMAAGISIICMLLMFFVIERPRIYDIRPDNEGGTTLAAPVEEAVLTAPQILRSRSFWILSLSNGVIAAGGTTMLTHMVPLAMQQGVPLEAASVLISIYGGAGLVGVIFNGWLIDRMGARFTYLVNVTYQVVLWLTLLAQVGGLFTLMFIAASIGACCTSVLVLLTAGISQIFGSQNVPGVMGTTFAVQLPFVCGAAPLAGYLVDATGSYSPPILIEVCGFVLVVAGILLLPARTSLFDAQLDVAVLQPTAD